MTVKSSYMDRWIGSETDRQITLWELQNAAQTGFMLFQLSLELLVQIICISDGTRGAAGVERASELISTLNIFPNIFLMSVNDPFLFPRVSPQTTVSPTTASKQEAHRAAPGERLATTFITVFSISRAFVTLTVVWAQFSPAGWDETEPALQLKNPVAGWARRNGPFFPSLFKPLMCNSLQLSVNIAFWMEWEMSGAGPALAVSQMKINTAVRRYTEDCRVLPHSFATSSGHLFPKGVSSINSLEPKVSQNDEFMSKHTPHKTKVYLASEMNHILLIASDKPHN